MDNGPKQMLLGVGTGFIGVKLHRSNPEVCLKPPSAVLKGCFGVEGDGRPCCVDAIDLNEQVQVRPAPGWVRDVPDFFDH